MRKKKSSSSIPLLRRIYEKKSSQFSLIEIRENHFKSSQEKERKKMKIKEEKRKLIKRIDSLIKSSDSIFIQEEMRLIKNLLISKRKREKK